MHQSDFNSHLVLELRKERYWRFLVKLREITCEDQDKKMRECGLCVVEFREKEKNKEDQDKEVRGCGLCGWTCGGKQRKIKRTECVEKYRERENEKERRQMVVWWRWKA